MMVELSLKVEKMMTVAAESLLYKKLKVCFI